MPRIGGKYLSNNTDSSPSLELIAARLAYAGATITTIGDVLSTISAGIALRLLEEENEPQKSNYTENDFIKMQKEIDQLIRELRHIRKMVNI